jgi:tetratricopeptide (TPR) repeat protein
METGPTPRRGQAIHLGTRLQRIFMARHASLEAGRAGQPARSQVVAFVLFGTVITVMVLLFSVLQYGRVEGQEFSPENFTRREFTYYEIPLLRVQVFPIVRQDCTNDLEQYLTSEKIIAAMGTPESQRRWDLVVATQGGSDQTRLMFSEGDARILCSYLDARDADNKIVWLEWTKQHREVAKVLWPLIAELARQELYFFVPDLLLAARGAKQAEELQPRLHQLLADRYVDLARTQQKLGQHALAVELYTEAIDLQPKSSVAYTGRAESLQVLGETERAGADLARAREIVPRR